MFKKLRLAWAARGAWRAISGIWRKESKMGKKPWESVQFWGVVLKVGAGLLTACGVLKNQVDDAQLNEFATHVPIVITGCISGIGMILETWGKRRHAEAAASLVAAKTQSNVGQVVHAIEGVK